jgi:inorganic triphosphatase YgiF
LGGVAVIEIELKFQVPAAQHAAVQRALSTATAGTTRLRARYFDTPDRRLARAGLALRLRKEGRRWLQTLKGAGDDALQRLEHEVALEPQVGVPGIDPERHAGTAAGTELATALGDGAPELKPVFETDVRRMHRRLRRGGASVEVALDVGVIRAGTAQQPLCEIEFELKSGQVDGLLALAARWANRHALWLDVRSKAERGDLLARGLQASPPSTARRPALDDSMSADAALRAIVRSCLAQILPNVSALAADCGTPEHLHQARVGLRRLDTALREFGDWSTAVDAAWQPALRAQFAPLGRARDVDALNAWLTPELQAAGAPMAELPAGASHDETRAALRDPAATLLLLELTGFAQPAPGTDDTAATQASSRPAELAASRLSRLHRQVKKEGAAFVSLDDATRHRTRRRLKRLRYSLEFVASLYPDKPLQRYLARLRPAQEVLGRYNDAAVAEAAFRHLLAHDARAWFALGWLAGQRARWLQDAAQALEALGRAEPCWPTSNKARRRGNN